MRKIFSLLSILSLSACAHLQRGPLVETCLLNTSDVDVAKWGAQCELKLPPDPTNPNNKSVTRGLREMDKNVCMPADDIKALLMWAHSR